jgi:hypothetical protein
MGVACMGAHSRVAPGEVPFECDIPGPAWHPGRPACSRLPRRGARMCVYCRASCSWPGSICTSARSTTRTATHRWGWTPSATPPHTSRACLHQPCVEQMWQSPGHEHA